MMKNHILLILMFLYSLFGVSQTYERYYKTQHDDVVYDAFQITNEEVVFVLNYGDYPDNYSSLLYKIDINTGSIIDSVVLFNDTNFTYQGISKILLTDSNILTIFGICENIATSDKQIFIAKYDISFEHIMDTIVGDNEVDEWFFDVIYSSDGLFVFSGMEEIGVLLLEERNIFGELIRKETFTEGGSFASTIYEDFVNNKYHLFRYWDTYHSFYIIDKGDLSVDTILEYPIGLLPTNAVKGTDSIHYYVAGRKLVLGDPEKDNLSYIKVNLDGDIINVWEYSTDTLEYYSYNSFSINDDYIFIGGTAPCTWTPPLEFYPEQRWIFLNKLDLEGNIIWQKYYKGNVNYMPFKVLATNDGGALIFSSFYDWNNPIPNQRDVHILKIDSLGYYTPLTGTPQELEQMGKQILVYPNPAENEVNFIFGLYKGLEINIFDLTGKNVFSKVFDHSAKIDISHFRPGVYPYVISGENGFYEEGKLIKK